jgi:hypothetical protein
MDPRHHVIVQLYVLSTWVSSHFPILSPLLLPPSPAGARSTCPQRHCRQRRLPSARPYPRALPVEVPVGTETSAAPVTLVALPLAHHSSDPAVAAAPADARAG